MKRTDICRDWILQAGEPSNIPGFRQETRKVNLPHDYMIETDVSPDASNGPNGGCYKGAVMSYTRNLDLSENLRGQRVMIRFDGCAGLTKVVLNGHVAGRHHYTYTPFTVDITKYINFGGKNRLTVTCGTDFGANARWYPGGGIYRHVELLTGPQVHLAVEPIYAHLSHTVDADAFVTLETEVENHTGENAIRWVELKMSPENFDGAPAEIFKNYRELEKIGLAAPQITYIMHTLKERGMNVDADAIRLEDAKQSILDYFKKQ